jgi:hypothetical protein
VPHPPSQVKEFVEELLSDINNQVGGMDHMISPKCIFDWVKEHKDTLDPHTVFYDEARVDEFKDQEPSKPEKASVYMESHVHCNFSFYSF